VSQVHHHSLLSPSFTSLTSLTSPSLFSCLSSLLPHISLLLPLASYFLYLFFSLPPALTVNFLTDITYEQCITLDVQCWESVLLVSSCSISKKWWSWPFGYNFFFCLLFILFYYTILLYYFIILFYFIILLLLLLLLFDSQIYLQSSSNPLHFQYTSIHFQSSSNPL